MAISPLSVIYYYVHNKKKLIPVLTSVTLSVFLLALLPMVLESSFLPMRHAMNESKEHYSVIMPKGELLSEKLVKGIAASTEGVDRAIPCIFDSTVFRTNIGNTYYVSILSLYQEDIKMLMSRMGLALKEGRLPAQGARELAVHEDLAKNKQLKIGSWLGRRLNKEESLPEAYRIVGIIKGGPLVSFGSIEAYTWNYHYEDDYINGALFLPKKGMLSAMNRQLDQFSPANYQITTLLNDQAEYDNIQTRLNSLISIMTVLVIFIVSSCVGFLFYIFYSARRSEFGVLWALGFSRQQVINRAFGEICLVNTAGFACGLLLILLVRAAVNPWLFEPIGQPLPWISTEIFLQSLCSPLFVTLFSILPIWRLLRRMDPIAVIEGGNP